MDSGVKIVLEHLTNWGEELMFPIPQPQLDSLWLAEVTTATQRTKLTQEELDSVLGILREASLNNITQTNAEGVRTQLCLLLDEYIAQVGFTEFQREVTQPGDLFRIIEVALNNGEELLSCYLAHMFPTTHSLFNFVEFESFTIRLTEEIHKSAENHYHSIYRTIVEALDNFTLDYIQNMSTSFTQQKFITLRQGKQHMQKLLEGFSAEFSSLFSREFSVALPQFFY